MSEKKKRTLADLLFSYEGRIGCGTYWAIFIIHILIISLLITGFFFAPKVDDAQDWLAKLVQGWSATIALIYMFPALWIAFATIAKRWHDIGWTGWMTLTQLIPYVNVLIFFVLGMIPGNKGSNEYGDGPEKLRPVNSR